MALSESEKVSQYVQLCIHLDTKSQRDRQTDRQTDSQTDRQTEKLMDREKCHINVMHYTDVQEQWSNLVTII